MMKKTQRKEEKEAELLELIKQQGSKLEQNAMHIEKLTKQSFEANIYKTRVTEMTMEIEFLRSKVRFMETNGNMQTTGSIGMSRMPSTMTHMNSGNLGMEDEAGEEFNNTYLDHMKRGGSQFSLEQNDVYSVKELQQRNSMYPQHMRGSYAICGIDQNIGEQEIKVAIFFTFMC